jgi:hypothetical protein
MSKLETLKMKLIDELEQYGGKKELSAGDLAIVDTLSHSIKNLCKVIEEDGDEGSSGRYYPMTDRGSYARGRMNARRDSRGRYSSEDYSRTADDIIDQLEGMLDSAPDERTRMKVKDLIREMKSV